MVNVATRVLLATPAIAPGIEGLLRELVHRPPHLQFAVRSKRHSSARQLRGNDAVEHIDAAVNALENVDRCAHAHEIARKIFRQMLSDPRRHVVALAVSFAYSQSSNGQAVKG